MGLWFAILVSLVIDVGVAREQNGMGGFYWVFFV